MAEVAGTGKAALFVTLPARGRSGHPAATKEEHVQKCCCRTFLSVGPPRDTRLEKEEYYLKVAGLGCLVIYFRRFGQLESNKEVSRDAARLQTLMRSPTPTVARSVKQSPPLGW